MEQISKEQMALIEEHLIRKFRKAVEANKNGEGTPVWKNLFFIMDLLGQGNFYGAIEWVMLGCSTKDVMFTRRTFRVDAMYTDIESPNHMNQQFPKDVLLKGKR